MSTAENRRKAYAIVADLVFQLVAGTGPSDSLPIEVRRELQRIYEAMAAAALVVDGPGVEEHVSGTAHAMTTRADTPFKGLEPGEES